MARTSDPRYQRSRQALRDALIELSHDDPERLTVSALCATSGVDRATFYRHARDIPALVADTIGALSDAAAARWIAVSTGSGRQETDAFTLSASFWELTERNRGLFRWALGPRGSAAAQHAVLDSFVRAVTHELNLVTPIARAASVPRTARLIAGAIYAVYLGWLDDEQPAPAGEIAREVVGELVWRFAQDRQPPPASEFAPFGEDRPAEVRHR